MNSWITASLSAMTRAAGFELIPTWRIEHLSFELFLKRLFSMYSMLELLFLRACCAG